MKVPVASMPSFPTAVGGVVTVVWLVVTGSVVVVVLGWVTVVVPAAPRVVLSVGGDIVSVEPHPATSSPTVATMSRAKNQHFTGVSSLRR